MKMLFTFCFCVLQLAVGVFSTNPQENEALPWHYDISERLQVPSLQTTELINSDDTKNVANKNIQFTNQDPNDYNFIPTNLPYYEKLMNDIKKDTNGLKYFHKPIWLKDVNYPYFDAPSNNVIRSKVKSPPEKAIDFSTNRMILDDKNSSEVNMKKPIMHSPLKVIQIPQEAENVKIQRNNLSKMDKSFSKASGHFQNDDFDQSQMDIYGIDRRLGLSIQRSERSIMDDPFPKMQVTSNYNSKTDEFRDEMFAPILTEIFPMVNPFESLNNMQFDVTDKNAYKGYYDQVLKAPFQANEKPFDDDVNYDLHISNKDEKLPREIRYPFPHIHSQLSSKTSVIPKIKSSIKLKEKSNQNKSSAKKIDNKQDDVINYIDEVDQENVKSKNVFYNFLQNYSKNIFKTSLEYENKVKAKI